MTESGKNRIMIYGPKTNGTYIIEFKTAAGEALAISVPAGETRVLKHFQERMPPYRRGRPHDEGSRGAGRFVAVDVDVCLRAPRRSKPNAQLCRNTRGGHVGIRQELAAGVRRF